MIPQPFIKPTFLTGSQRLRSAVCGNWIHASFAEIPFSLCQQRLQTMKTHSSGAMRAFLDVYRFGNPLNLLILNSPLLEVFKYRIIWVNVLKGNQGRNRNSLAFLQSLAFLINVLYDLISILYKGDKYHQQK